MIRRFVDDDSGYIAWLQAHPLGYVLNTFPHVSSAYLVLHRASCRTINRPLAANRRWTAQYGKSCSDDRAELERWAAEETGKSASPCGSCHGSAASRPAVAAASARLLSSASSRSARGSADAVKFDGPATRVIVVPSSRHGPAAPRLVIEGAQWLAETFFAVDPSATGKDSYDAWIAQIQDDSARRDHIAGADITAINRTMAARSPQSAWVSVVADPRQSWLAAIDPTIDLFDLADADWDAIDLAAKLRACFEATSGPSRKLAVITKVLHIKRPRLIPVLDSIVMQQIGAPQSDDIGSWVAAVRDVGRIGRENRAPLREIETHLASRGIVGRSHVRILDALLWVSSPGAGLFSSLGRWERVVRPRGRS